MNKEEKRRTHRARMAERRARQLARTAGHSFLENGRWSEIKTRPKPILANVSRKHPDYGKAPRDHAAAKAARNAQ